MALRDTAHDTCAICGRGILKGERTYAYATPAGDVRDVCALCRPSAESAGWVPPDRLVHVGQARPQRRPGRLAALLAKRPDRSPAPADADPPARAASAVPDPAQQPRPAAVDPFSETLLNFNAGSTPRMIAGLNRSLGQARADVRRSKGGDGIVVTVAWELSWYAWEVKGSEAREVAKGGEITEREGGEPDWNARVEDDGRVTLAVTG